MDSLKLGEQLEQSYPQTDLIGLTDESLAEMIEKVGAEVKERTATWFYQVKMAWVTACRGGPEDTSMQVDL